MPNSRPTSRQTAVLTAVHAAGGYIEHLDDEAAIDECVEAGWLTAEDHHGYALTLDGTVLARESGAS